MRLSHKTCCPPLLIISSVSSNDTAVTDDGCIAGFAANPNMKWVNFIASVCSCGNLGNRVLQIKVIGNCSKKMRAHISLFGPAVCSFFKNQFFFPFFHFLLFFNASTETIKSFLHTAMLLDLGQLLLAICVTWDKQFDIHTCFVWSFIKNEMVFFDVYFLLLWHFVSDIQTYKES